MARKQLNVRKSVQDETVIASIKAPLSLGDTDIFRLAIREFARKRGYWCSDLEEMLEVIGEGVSMLRSEKVKGVSRILARADRVLQVDRATVAEREANWIA